MSTLRSITGRTVVEASVGEMGDTKVRVYRNGQCVNEFSLPVEDGLSTHSELRKREDGSIEIWQDGAMGIKKLDSRWQNGVEVGHETIA